MEVIILQKKKSSKLITGGEFNIKIPSEATTVVFTSEKAPKGATTTDLTVAKDGDVVGWLDGTTWKVSTQDSSKVVNFNQYSSGMFYYKKSLTNIDFNNVDTSNVTNMCEMFDGCSKLTSLDLSNFDTSNVTYMYAMFLDCSNLTNIYASPRWSTKNIKDGENMFENCEKLPNYNASVINITKAHTGQGGYLTLKA